MSGALLGVLKWARRTELWGDSSVPEISAGLFGDGVLQSTQCGSIYQGPPATACFILCLNVSKDWDNSAFQSLRLSFHPLNVVSGIFSQKGAGHRGPCVAFGFTVSVTVSNRGWGYREDLVLKRQK